MATRSTTCPNCGLLCPRDSVCDCGLNLASGYMPPTAKPKRERSNTEQMLRGAGFFFTLAPLRFVSSVGEGGPLAWTIAAALSAALAYLYWRFVWRE